MSRRVGSIRRFLFGRRTSLQDVSLSFSVTGIDTHILDYGGISPLRETFSDAPPVLRGNVSTARSLVAEIVRDVNGTPCAVTTIGLQPLIVGTYVCEIIVIWADGQFTTYEHFTVGVNGTYWVNEYKEIDP